MSYQDIVQHRLASLGHWRYYQRMVHPFWRDGAIFRGLKELFDIFMTHNLVTDDDGTGGPLYDPSKAADVVCEFHVEDKAIQVRPLTLSQTPAERRGYPGDA
jgi:hypothetical protein